MTNQLAELLADDTAYCCYCGNEKGTAYHCCGENHFETFAQMSSQDQQNILDQEV